MSTIQLSPLGTYKTGIYAASAAEILAFDPVSDRLFVTNTANNVLTILNASNPNQLNLIQSIDLSVYGAGINSVAVKNGIVAVAIESNPKQAPGKVVFFNTDGTFLKSVTVGALPDMLTFSPDGTKLLVANEGEPNDSYTNDAEGSVSIIDLSGGVASLTQANVKTASFTGFVKQALIDQGVRIYGPGSTAAQDLEPEYITISSDSTTAWATLQENNALAKINLSTGAVEILPLGYKDHSLRGNELDASNRDGAINIRNWPVFGMYQPDAIAAYEASGQTYLVMTNEGDSRAYSGFNEEARIADADVVLDPTAFPNAAELKQAANLGRLKITKTLGDTDGDGDYDRLYAYGARSFSIRDANGKLVFDSGADLERITAHFFPNDFNSSDEENDSFDDRSDDKGPEPEALAVGKINGRTYAFVGLERTSGIVVYDITNPTDAEFVQYINTRDFSGDVAAGTAGDVSPEGFTFISAADSPTGEPLLAVANEISGSTSLYRINVNAVAPPGAIGGTGGNESLNGTGNADQIYGFGGSDQIFAQAGNDTVYAGEGNDQVSGGLGDDLIQGQGGTDTLRGEDGHDLIWGSLGNDTIEGGTGNDNLYGGENSDILRGGDGSDYLDGGIGNDVVEGGEGDDSIKGGEGDDKLYGGNGNDFFDGGYGFEHFDGGAGNDTVTMAYRHAGVDIDLGYGTISFFDQPGYETLRSIENAIGTEFGDWIEGNSAANRLEGLGGRDNLIGEDGDDTLLGGNGRDFLDGQFGQDFLNGGDGSDDLEGGIGNDTMIGGRGSDALYGQSGADTLIGVDPSLTSVGVGEIDFFCGGYGADRFVLGDRNRVYYDDRDNNTSGTGDYAYVSDFVRLEGDVIQLQGDASQYVLGSVNSNTGIFLKSTTGGRNELIAVVDGLSLSTQLTSSAFEYVKA